MPLPQWFPQSSYTWGQLFDYTARRAGSGAQFPAPDQLLMCQAVSSFAYDRYLWPWTLATTPAGSIPCQNTQQDYPLPSDAYRLSRAWFRVPTQITLPDGSLLIDNTPQDDPSAAAATSAALSAAYVAGFGQGGGTPAAITWPRDGTLTVVKRLPVNLIMRGYVGIRACTQMTPGLVRLDSATAVNLSQPYSLELEYQYLLPIIAALTDPCWFPDSYLAIAEEGLRYRIYRDRDDTRAGTASFANGQVAYSGQLAVWMNAMEQAAAAERAGSVDAIVPSESLGAGGGWSGYNGFGGGGYW